MFFIYTLLLVVSLIVKINNVEYSGESFDDVLESYGSGNNTINSIIVVEGMFPVNSLSNTYTDLSILEVPENSFTGSINDGLFKNMDLLKTVIIDGAKTIGSNAFENCHQLETIQFSSCTTINSRAFQSCTLLQNVNIPNVQIIKSYGFSGTIIRSAEFASLIEIGDYTFCNCTLLSELTIPSLKTMGSYCFKETAIKSLTLNNLTQMSNSGYSFDSCKLLESIIIDRIEIIPSYSFNNCSSLHTIVGSKVTIVKGNCFKDCQKLKTTIFPSLITIDSNAFYGLISIEEVDFPNVTTVGSSAYMNCIALKTVVLNSCYSIGYSAFYGCISLSRVEMPDLKTASYTCFRNIMAETLEFPKLDTLYIGKVDGTSNVGGQFMECTHLKSFKAPLLPYIVSKMFSGCILLTELKMDEASTIGSDSFSGCTSLTTLILPKIQTISANQFTNNNVFIHIEMDSVTTIGNYAFQSCRNLETVIFKNCTVAGKYAFNSCTKLENIIMPKLLDVGARVFSYTIINKIELNALSFASTDKYNSEYHGSQFEGCTSLTHVTMKNMSYVQIQMFYNCNQLIYVDMPSLKTIYYQGFSLCSSLSNLTFPSLNEIGENAFEGLPGLIDINLPSVTKISNYAFNSCPNLVSFSSENCSFILDYAFNNCPKLENIYLPKLREIGARVFSYTNLSSIELNSLVYAGTVKYSSADHGAQFHSCCRLKEVTMKSMSYIQIEMFYNCYNLSFIDVPLVYKISSSSFINCTALSNLTFPSLNEIGENAFEELPGLIDINLPSVTKISNYAFNSCPNLVSFSSENCSFILDYAFNNCPKLENIYLPKLREIGARVFSYTNLSSIELNSLVYAGTTKYNNAYHGAQFYSCCRLKEVTMKSMSYIQIEMFYNCYNLSFIDAPQVFTISRNAFINCTSLNNLSFPALSNIGEGAFNTYQGIVEADFPSISTISSNAFYRCPNLISFSSQSCTSVGSYAFYECPNLITFSAPNCTSIGSYAFAGCPKLLNLFIENVTFVGQFAFNNCNNLETINFPHLYEMGGRAFSYTAIKEIELNSVTIASSYTSNDNDYGGHFMGCKSLTHVTMKKLSYVQIQMFYNCQNLIYVDMPILQNINEQGFYLCPSLTNLSFPKLNTIGEKAFYTSPGLVDVNFPYVTSVSYYAFSNCKNLVSFSAEKCTIVYPLAFNRCEKLEKIYLPNLRDVGAFSFSNTNLISIELNSLAIADTYWYDYGFRGAHFSHCKALKKITLNRMPYLQRDMFYGCTNLEEINIPSCTTFESDCISSCPYIKRVTLGFKSISYGSISSGSLTHISFPHVTSIPDNSFLNFKNLVSCKFPMATTIGSSAFQGCLKLSELEIPNVVEILGDYNFYNCENLQSLSLRSLVTVNSSSLNIFQGCRGLQYIAFPDRPPRVFNRNTFNGLTCKIYIPAESIDIYDNDVSIEGDAKGDNMWCGIQLASFDMIKIIGDEITSVGTSLNEACIATGLEMESIVNLTIVSGHLSKEELNSFKDNFPNVEKLIIESSVSFEEDTIPRNFFLNHQNVKTVLILSSIKIIDESAFQGCINLATIDIPNAKELKSKCFYGPTLLEMISFALVDTLSGSHFFSNNLYLKNIELPNLETATITGYISENSPQLSTISLPETPPKLVQGKFLFDIKPYLIGISNKAAIEYDAADTIDNDILYYSLKLNYTHFIVSVDGERKSGLTLKSLIQDGSKIVEIIQGEIVDSDFPFPDTITSFTTREEVSVKNIPSYGFSENSNLKTVTIFSSTKFTIEEEAFLGCTSLTFVQINNATALEGLAFKGCSNLKTAILDNVETIIGNSHFEGCNELKSISLLSLKTIPKSSNRIFLGCSKFTTIKLPSKPPQRFNKDVFAGLQDQLNLVLPAETDYLTYDNDRNVDEDVQNDGLWCGIALPTAIINIRVNQKSNIYNGLHFSDCIASTGLQESQIISLEILRGVLPLSSFINSIKNLPYLEKLKILPNVVYRGEFENGLFSGLNIVSISLPNVQTIPQEFFKDCVKLNDVEINDATKICDSSFKGCKSLETISLNVDTFEGDSQFEGCLSLQSISITKLVNVNPTSENIFFGCPLTSINLPITPPKTFNKNTFNGKTIVIHGLTNDQLRAYDSNTDVEGDEPNDLKWCGIDLIQLYITVSINGQQPVNSSTISSATELIPTTEVKSIEIQQGMVKKSHLNELRNFKELTRLTITENAVLESSIIEENQFQNMTNFIHVKIMHNVTLMKNCFRGCSSLLSIEFAEVNLVSEGSFRNCSSLNTIKIPYCKELRGDFIFSGCSNLRDIDLSYLITVDSSASRIFEDCNQLIMLRLPSIEPLTFHKNTFENCSDISLILPTVADYLVYDDQSHVIDDSKEDEKWCGIKIDSAFFPPMLIYKINGIECRSRKLMNIQNDNLSLGLLLEEDENGNNDKSKLKVLELIGGLVDPLELKDMIRNNPSIEKFETQIGTLSEIASGTFDGCNLLKEIIIHTEIYISPGALQNIPSLLKLEMDLQQTIRGDELAGDINLQEISFPLLSTIPSGTFSNLTDLKKIRLDTASLMHGKTFMNCISLENLELPQIRIIDGDSHFEGCINLKTIDLSSLSSVYQSSSRILMNCNQLSEIKLGMEPPIQFNDDIFNNAGVIPTIVIPSSIGWRNYIPQCTIDPENNHYIWYGFDTGLEKDEEVEISCPEQNECSCPEVSYMPCPTQIEYSPPTAIKGTISITLTLYNTFTNVLRKSVSFSMGPTLSYIRFGTYISGEYTEIETQSYIFSYLPYVIRFYSLTNSQTMHLLEIIVPKKKLTAEMLIGITCGGTAVFFISLACIIFYCRNLKERELMISDDFSISDDEVKFIDRGRTDNDALNVRNDNHKLDDQNDSSNFDYWF